MYILKAILLYLLVAAFPAMIVYLTFSGALQVLFVGFILISTLIVFLYSDKFTLLFLQAREVIDSDNQKFFQALKTEIYNELETMPSVYLYSGHRIKAFVLSLRNTWSIVLDRNLIRNLDEAQTKALIRYLIEYKKSGASRAQTIGMGVSTFIIRFVYWFWEKVQLSPKNRLYKLFVFISFIMIKPLIEVILKLSVNDQKSFCELELRPIFLQVDQDIRNRSFIEFMVLHLESDLDLSESTIEYLEGFPLLENCKFKEVII